MTWGILGGGGLALAIPLPRVFLYQIAINLGHQGIQKRREHFYLQLESSRCLQLGFEFAYQFMQVLIGGTSIVSEKAPIVSN